MAKTANPDVTMTEADAEFLDAFEQGQKDAASAQKAMRTIQTTREVVAANPNKKWVAAPGGKVGLLEDFIDNTLDFLENDTIFANAEKWIENPEPGAHYGWPRKDDGTMAKIHSGFYKAVKPAETVDKSATRVKRNCPVATHKDPTGELCVYYGHILVEIPAETYRRYFLYPQRQGFRRIATAGDRFASNIDSLSAGKASGHITTVDEDV